MTIDDIVEKIEFFKGDSTVQSWRKDDDFNFENEYICVKRIDSSNVSGGKRIRNGKQWSVIFDLKQDFQSLPNWRQLKGYYAENLKVTKVMYGTNKGKYGMRFYKMSKNPTDTIILEILNFIFIG